MDQNILVFHNSIKLTYPSPVLVHCTFYHCYDYKHIASAYGDWHFVVSFLFGITFPVSFVLFLGAFEFSEILVTNIATHFMVRCSL